VALTFDLDFDCSRRSPYSESLCVTPLLLLKLPVLFILRDDIQEAAGAHQLCAGQLSGVEAAVHTVRRVFEGENTEAVLIVDASNAFNH